MSECIVITGMGCVTPSGNGIDALRGSLFTGNSGVRIEGPSPEEWSLAPEPIDFRGRISRLVLRKLDATMRQALRAALEATEQAGLDLAEFSDRRGVVVGTGFAGSRSSQEFIQSVWDYGPDGADPSSFPNTVPNGAAGQLAIRLKAGGPGTNFFEADTSGESALAYAIWELSRGSADAMVVCGIDERSAAAVTAEAWFRRARGGAASDGILRPFDAVRTGTAMGEASTAVVLETGAGALARGAERLAVVGPVALGAEATPPGRWPSEPESYLNTMREALHSAGVDPGGVAFVNASACGSPRFDAFEADALERLGVRSPVTAPAGLTGRLAASGIFRLIVSVLALRDGCVPPTARLRTVDTALSVPVSGERRNFEGRQVLQVGSGYGAGHAALVVTSP